MFKMYKAQQNKSDMMFLLIVVIAVTVVISGLVTHDGQYLKQDIVIGEIYCFPLDRNNPYLEKEMLCEEVFGIKKDWVKYKFLNDDGLIFGDFHYSRVKYFKRLFIKKYIWE